MRASGYGSATNSTTHQERLNNLQVGRRILRRAQKTSSSVANNSRSSSLYFFELQNLDSAAALHEHFVRLSQKLDDLNEHREALQILNLRRFQVPAYVLECLSSFVPGVFLTFLSDGFEEILLKMEPFLNLVVRITILVLDEIVQLLLQLTQGFRWLQCSKTLHFRLASNLLGQEYLAE